MASKFRPYFCVLLLTPIFSFLLLIRNPPESIPALPPLLSRLPLPPRPNHLRHLPAADSWKRPAVLTLYASYNTIDPHHVSLVIITTGIYAKSFDRLFHSVGCWVGGRVFKVKRVEWELVECDVERGALREGILVSVVLEKDEGMKEAMKGEVKLHGQRFVLEQGDVVEVEGGVRIGKGVKWESAFLEEIMTGGVRYEMCLMTVMKQYGFLLGRWVDFYKRVGVDRVYVYDNGADDDLKRVLNKWEGFVETVFWPWPRSQMQSNNHFLLASKGRCRWVAFFDADEFVMVGGDGEEDGVLKKYVRKKEGEGYRQIAFHFMEMVNSGYVKRPVGDLPELYTRRAEVQTMANAKVVVDVGVQWDHHRIHLVTGKGGKRYWNETLELEPRGPEDNAMLVHYTRRSWEDYVAKNRIGGASVLTAGRPPKMLEVDKPDMKYMNEKGVQFVGFRNRWRRIMKRKWNGKVRITWRGYEGRTCRAWLSKNEWQGHVDGEICELLE